jgi:membrane associated rhomboid family serine protease
MHITGRYRQFTFIATSLIAVLAYLLGMHHEGGAGAPKWHALVYQWCHCNVWHLIANIYCVWMIARSNYRVVARQVAYAYAISIVMVFLSVPTQGMSGIIYALLGMLSWQSARIRTYHLWMAGFLLLGLVLPKVNVTLHLLCYGAGLISETFHSPWRMRLEKYWS